MNTLRMTFLLISALFLSAQARASCVDVSADMLLAAKSGDKGGNAGTGMEILFRAKADEILNWVKRNRLSQLDTHGVDKNELSERLLTQKWRVCMVDQKVYVDGRERTCRNSFDSTHPDLIECSLTAFETRETDESRYALVFHELLGVAGVENNLEGESDDSISRQILKFIGMKMSPYLADEHVRAPGKVTFIKDPIHQESGLPFGIVYDGEGSWICRYLGFSEYVGGMAVEAKKAWSAHFTDSDYSFRVTWNMATVQQIGCR